MWDGAGAVNPVSLTCRVEILRDAAPGAGEGVFCVSGAFQARA